MHAAEDKDSFEKFQEMVRTTCEVPTWETQVEYPWITDANPLIAPEKFTRVEEYQKDVPVFRWDAYPGIDAMVKVYKTNMNNLYSCGVVQVQKQALKNLEARIKGVVFAPEVKKSFEPKLQEAKRKLNMIKFKNTQWKEVACVNQADNQTYIKLNMLKQATYLTCEYNVYMQYAKDYYAQPGNVFADQDTSPKDAENATSYAFTEVENRLYAIQNRLNDEIDRAYQVFSLAYNAYSEYEHNIAAHLYLWLLREDFYVFRQELHNVLNPLNQVVYKISNAQKD